MNKSDDYPIEIQNKLVSFHEALKKVKEVTEPLLKLNLDIDYEKLTPMEKAKIDLSSAYAMNSLFWMYLVTKGENAKEHRIKAELDRIKMHMLRANEIADKEKAPKINKDGVQRFIRSSLWEPSDKESQQLTESAKRKVDEIPLKKRKKIS